MRRFRVLIEERARRRPWVRCPPNLEPRSPTARWKGDLTFQPQTEWDLGSRLMPTQIRSVYFLRQNKLLILLISEGSYGAKRATVSTRQRFLTLFWHFLIEGRGFSVWKFTRERDLRLPRRSWTTIEWIFKKFVKNLGLVETVARYAL